MAANRLESGSSGFLLLSHSSFCLLTSGVTFEIISYEILILLLITLSPFNNFIPLLHRVFWLSSLRKIFTSQQCGILLIVTQNYPHVNEDKLHFKRSFYTH